MDYEAAWKEIKSKDFNIRDQPSECPMCNRTIGSGDLFTEWENMTGLDLKPATICLACSVSASGLTGQKWPSRIGAILLPEHQDKPTEELPAKVRTRLKESLNFLALLKSGGKL